jgi:hypothetical protein
MQKILFIFLCAFITLLMQACAQTQKTQQIETVVLNKAHFKTQLFSEQSISNEAITFSTINGFQKKPRNISKAWTNNYITGRINKKTGKTTYQIHSLIEYKDHDKRIFKEVSYNTDTGKETKEAIILDHVISCKGSAYSGCIHTEHVVFSIEPILIENIANSYTKDSQNKWHYQLSPKKGRSYSAHLFISEIAAMVETAKEYKAL